MIICISGTPGAGKTTLARRISRDFAFRYIDGNLIIKENGLKERYDKNRDCYVVDKNKFAKAVMDFCKKYAKKSYVVDSHLSHHLPRKDVALCIICRCGLKVLKSRLEKRGYSKNKVRENLDAEIFEVCLTEAKEKKHKVIEYDKNYKELKKELSSVIS